MLHSASSMQCHCLTRMIPSCPLVSLLTACFPVAECLISGPNRNMGREEERERERERELARDLLCSLSLSLTYPSASLRPFLHPTSFISFQSLFLNARRLVHLPTSPLNVPRSPERAKKKALITTFAPKTLAAASFPHPRPPFLPP